MFRSTTLALALTAALAAPALADDMKPNAGLQPEQIAALTQANTVQVRITENYAVQAYQANVNPLSFMLEKVGPYDLEDAYVGANGYALPGWAMMANPATVGGNGDSGG